MEENGREARGGKRASGVNDRADAPTPKKERRGGENKSPARGSEKNAGRGKTVGAKTKRHSGRIEMRCVQRAVEPTVGRPRWED